MPKKGISTRKLKQKTGHSWRAVSPMLQSERKKFTGACERKCFLDSKNRKYPICKRMTRKTKNCKIDIQGVAAAAKRARLVGNKHIERKALALYKKMTKKSEPKKRQASKRAH